ncbi:MAG: hypothetical protein L0Z47_07150 [Actinobacteria bacterium]|nr:hypothetical protein [Actinomycetota bacterium]
MLPRSAWLLMVSCFLGACAATPAGSTSTIVVTTSSVATTVTTSPPRPCPPAPFGIGYLPININEAGFDPGGAEPDVWTSVGGSTTTFFGRTDGTVAIALIRGTLPAVDWPGDKGETTVDGVRAAVGPHPDGTWVMGWYHDPAERCDLYTMVFYPPWDPSEVERVILSMVRVPG